MLEEGRQKVFIQLHSDSCVCTHDIPGEIEGIYITVTILKQCCSLVDPNISEEMDLYGSYARKWVYVLKSTTGRICPQAIDRALGPEQHHHSSTHLRLMGLYLLLGLADETFPLPIESVVR